MKEKDIWLSPEELQRMLRGSLQWNDVAAHVNRSKNGIRKLGATNLTEKQPTPKQIKPKELDRSIEKGLDRSIEKGLDRSIEKGLDRSTEKELDRSTEKELDQSIEKEADSKRLEGQPVIWLLGSVGLLTLSSWFYFVLFSK